MRTTIPPPPHRLSSHPHPMHARSTHCTPSHPTYPSTCPTQHFAPAAPLLCKTASFLPCLYKNTTFLARAAKTLALQLWHFFLCLPPAPAWYVLSMPGITTEKRKIFRPRPGIQLLVPPSSMPAAPKQAAFATDMVVEAFSSFLASTKPSPTTTCMLLGTGMDTLLHGALHQLYSGGNIGHGVPCRLPAVATLLHTAHCKST